MAAWLLRHARQRRSVLGLGVQPVAVNGKGADDQTKKYQKYKVWNNSIHNALLVLSLSLLKSIIASVKNIARQKVPKINSGGLKFPDTAWPRINAEKHKFPELNKAFPISFDWTSLNLRLILNGGMASLLRLFRGRVGTRSVGNASMVFNLALGSEFVKKKGTP